MYNLNEIDTDLYQIHSSVKGVQAMEGSLLHILTYCTHVLKFDPNELEVALLDMLKNGKNTGHFGLGKTFLYSFNRNEKKVG